MTVVPSVELNSRRLLSTVTPGVEVTVKVTGICIEMPGGEVGVTRSTP